MKLQALVVIGVSLWPLGAQAATVNLGTAAAFGVLGATTVTNTGPTVIGGELGGLPPNFDHRLSARGAGAVDDNDAVAAQAQADALTAYNAAAWADLLPT